MLRDLRSRYETVRNGLTENPIAVALQNFPERFKTPAPLNFANQGELEAGLAYRAQISQFASQNWEAGALPALDKADLGQIRATLSSASGPAAGAILAAMAKALPPETYMATMTAAPVREGLDGMVRTYEPAKLSFAMGTLDRLWRLDPQGFARSFGPESVKRLQLWQSWKDSFSDAEIAERFKRADDPAMGDARKRLGEAADDELKKIKAPDVVSNVYAAEHPILSWVPFTGPAAPGDELQNARMVEDYSQVYKDLRMSGMDADQAKKQSVARLSLTWGRSEAANGDRLMRFPPERYYERVGGSHSWMKDQIETDLEKQLGKPRTTTMKTDLGPRTTDNWRYEVIPDANTEADVAAKKTPSYVVVVTDAATGRKNVVMDGDQRPLRYRWDATASRASAQAAFDDQRNAVLEGRGDIR